MIIIFILLWFSVLRGMEQETSEQKEIFPVPALKEIVVRAVCNHVIDGKITIDDVWQLPSDEQELIQSLIKSEPEKVKGGEFYDLSTITPNHRYMLVTGNQGLLRLDLWTNQTVVIDDSKENIWPKPLSPSGNLVGLATLQKIWIKDIAQNKVIVERDRNDLNSISGTSIYMPGFMGEKGFLLAGCGWIQCILIKGKLDEYKGLFRNVKYIGVLHCNGEFVVYKKGCFSRITTEGNEIKEIKAPAFTDYFYTKSKYACATLYEPQMLIAYERSEGGINIQSLETAEILSELQYTAELSELSFAHKGDWLIASEERTITIWNWQYKQKLFEFPWNNGRIYHLAYTDYPIPYPCLFKSNNVLYVFDPVKAVAAAMLFPALPGQTAEISNNKSNNNNSNISNDNGPRPAKSNETSKQDNGERKHKRPKK